MTLLDAPLFNEVRERRKRNLYIGSVGLLVVLFIGWWMVAGRPVDWPWRWNDHMIGRMEVNSFFSAVEKNDLSTAYGIWNHDKNWQQHPVQGGAYPFSKFQQDWSSTSPENEYGAIQSHKIAAARMYGNVLLVGVLINERKSKAMFLDYDPKTHKLNFSPPDVELYLGK